ncbi:hypothetical protein D3C73_1286430 [compost metagenome]
MLPIGNNWFLALTPSSFTAPVLVTVISDFSVVERIVQDFLYGCRGEGVACLRLVAAVI